MSKKIPPGSILLRKCQAVLAWTWTVGLVVVGAMIGLAWGREGGGPLVKQVGLWAAPQMVPVTALMLGVYFAPLGTAPPDDRAVWRGAFALALVISLVHLAAVLGAVLGLAWIQGAGPVNPITASYLETWTYFTTPIQALAAVAIGAMFGRQAPAKAP
jgi:hypothetical protein